MVWEIKYRPIKKVFSKKSEVELGKSFAWEVKGTGRGEVAEDSEDSEQLLEVSLGDEETVVLEEDEDGDEDA